MISNDYGTQLKNIGMQLQNMGLEIQNMGMQNPYIFQNQLQNIGIQVSNYGIQIFNFGVQMTNIINNIQGINMNFNIQMSNMLNQMKMMEQMNPLMINNNNNEEKNKCNNSNCSCNNPNYIRIILDYCGERKFFVVNKEQNVEEIFNKYLEEKNLDKNNIDFFYNASKLKYNNKTKFKETPLVNCSVIIVYEYNRINL